MDKQVLAGKFEIQKELARGTTGTIYYGYDLDLRREVVIKTYHSHINGRLTRGKSFIEKTQSILKIDHPNLIKIFKVEEENDTPIVFMDFFDGTSLEHRLHDQGPLPFETMLLLARGIAEGLVHLHFQGIIHGTLDPGHVLVGPQHQVKVTDLGLTRILMDTLTDHDGDLLRPLPYLPPESAKGEPLSFSSDLYCFGFMMYEMLTQTTPYSNLPKTSIMGKLAFDQSDPNFDFPASVPEGIQDLIRQMTRNKAKNRLHDTTHVLTIINQKLAKLSPVEIHPAPESEKPQTDSPAISSEKKDPPSLPEPVSLSEDKPEVEIKETEQIIPNQTESLQEKSSEKPTARELTGENNSKPSGGTWPGKWWSIIALIVFIGGASAGYWFRDLLEDAIPVSTPAVPPQTLGNKFSDQLSTDIHDEHTSPGLEVPGSLTNEGLPTLPETPKTDNLQSNSMQEPLSPGLSLEKRVPETSAVPFTKKPNKLSTSQQESPSQPQSPKDTSVNSTQPPPTPSLQKETSHPSKEPPIKRDPPEQSSTPSSSEIPSSTSPNVPTENPTPTQKSETAAQSPSSSSDKTRSLSNPASQELLNSVDSTEQVVPTPSSPKKP